MRRPRVVLSALTDPIARARKRFSQGDSLEAVASELGCSLEQAWHWSADPYQPPPDPSDFPEPSPRARYTDRKSVV